LVDIGVVLAAGLAIGAERESRKKPAGISTHCLVIGGAMVFTFLSSLVDPNSSSRIAAHRRYQALGLGSRHYLEE
jgi:putative Mg2+ transporter-C (MgtC) family protein